MITQHSRPYVHTMLVFMYLQPLQSEEVGQSGPCNQLSNNINFNRGPLIAVWAGGGEVRRIDSDNLAVISIIDVGLHLS